MKWYELTEAQKADFMQYVENEYRAENGYIEEEIQDFKKDIYKNLYYIEEGLTFQF